MQIRIEVKMFKIDTQRKQVLKITTNEAECNYSYDNIMNVY